MKTLVLDGTAISIQVAMSTSAATTNPTFVASYADNAGSGITEGATDGSLNGSTDVTVVPAPTGSNRRVIKDITIYNGDTANVTIYVKYDNNATQRTVAKVLLAPGDTWTTDGTFDGNGSLKQTVGTVNLTSGVTGTLAVSNGGTGATTLTGVIKGNGTSAITAATAGTDYAKPDTASTWTAAQTFRASNAIRSEAASTQDAVVIAGRAGGTSSYAVTVTPTTLTASRTVTLPDASTNISVSSYTITWSGLTAARTITLPDADFSVGYLNIPQNSQSAAYTLVLADSGKHILHPSADTTARTFTIPANSSVAFPVGTAITFINQNGAGVVTIAITTDTMRLAGAGTTGSRTLAANGVATAIKITSTEWIISGSGLT